MKPRPTENKCRSCGHEFQGAVVLQPDGNWRHTTDGMTFDPKCPSCGGNYWDWMNYEREFAA